MTTSLVLAAVCAIFTTLCLEDVTAIRELEIEELFKKICPHHIEVRGGEVLCCGIDRGCRTVARIMGGNKIIIVDQDILSDIDNIAAQRARCYQAVEVGPCEARIPRYFYNFVTQKCELFGYGGCKGNANNFATKEECVATCEPRARNDAWDGPIRPPYCELAAETGVCRALMHRFYYDKDEGRCKSFVYGGCGGNKNNFLTQELCEETCQ